MFREIDRLFEAMAKDFEQHPLSRNGISSTPSVDPREYDGYKVEEINGERTEYVYDDGEWKELPLETEEEGGVNVTETSVTIDLTEYGVSQNFNTVAEATVNNGILDVTFGVESDKKA